MSWHAHLNSDPRPWLLEQSGPGVRYLALRDLLDLSRCLVIQGALRHPLRDQIDLLLRQVGRALGHLAVAN